MMQPKVQEQCQARSTIFAKIKTNLDLGSRFFRVNAMRCLGGCGWWNSCRSVHENHHTTAHVAACFVVRSWRPLHPAGQIFPVLGLYPPAGHPGLQHFVRPQNCSLELGEHVYKMFGHCETIFGDKHDYEIMWSRMARVIVVFVFRN